MTQQHESRWSLSSTGNRVLFAVLAGLFVSFVGRQLDLVHGAVGVLLFALVAGVTYLALTGLTKRRP